MSLNEQEMVERVSPEEQMKALNSVVEIEREGLAQMQKEKVNKIQNPKEIAETQRIKDRHDAQKAIEFYQKNGYASPNEVMKMVNEMVDLERKASKPENIKKQELNAQKHQKIEDFKDQLVKDSNEMEFLMNNLKQDRETAFNNMFDLTEKDRQTALRGYMDTQQMTASGNVQSFYDDLLQCVSEEKENEKKFTMGHETINATRNAVDKCVSP